MNNGTQTEQDMDWKHLHRYGYAPGDYMGVCRCCGKEQYDLDKRATHCRKCAEQLYNNQQETATNQLPLLGDIALLSDSVSSNPL